MSERFDLPVMDLGGGLNLGPQPSDIADNEQCSLVNYLPVASELRMRPGLRARTPHFKPNGVTDSNLTSLHMWSGGNPREWELFAGASEAFGRYSPVTDLWTTVPRTDTGGVYTPYPTSTEPWVMLQHRGIIYAFRRDVGMRRIERSPTLGDSPPGIPAPTATPTLAAGGAGAIPAANFRGFVTYYNTLTGAESNPGPASATYTHAGTLMISWTGLPTTAPVPQVNAIRLYRTLPDEVGVGLTTVNGYLVTTLPLGTASYAVDNKLVDALGAIASTRNSVPPVGLRGGVIWQECLWVHDGRFVYKSELNKPESIPSSSAIAVFQDDGQEVVGLAADETRLYVGKERRVVFFTGTPSNLDRDILDDNNGVRSQHTMKAVAGQLIWRSANDVLVSSGGPGRSLAPGEKLRTYMDALRPSDAASEVAAVWPKKKLYLWMGRFTRTRPAEHKPVHPHEVKDRDILAVNYETGAWGVIRPEQTTYTVGFLFNTQDENQKEQVYAAWGPMVHEFEHGLYHDEVPTASLYQEAALECLVLPREHTAPPGFIIKPRYFWLDSTLRTTKTGAAQSERFRLEYYLEGRYVNSPIVAHPFDAVLPDRNDQRFAAATVRSGAKLLIGFRREGIKQSFDVYGYGLSGRRIKRTRQGIA